MCSDICRKDALTKKDRKTYIQKANERWLNREYDPSKRKKTFYMMNKTSTEY